MVKLARPTADLKQGRTDWYRIENVTNGEAEVLIYDEIGYWGVTAKDFVNELNALDVETIKLRINSPGGDVFAGVAILNAIRNHKATIHVVVDGLAASAASFIAMGGDTVTMARNSMMMIHEASSFAWGNAKDLRARADLLEKISADIASVYAGKASGTDDEWRAAMVAETWYSADEAVEAGLADSVQAPEPDGDEPEKPADNSWDLSIFTYAGRDQAPDPIFPAATGNEKLQAEQGEATPNPWDGIDFSSAAAQFRRAMEGANG
jgi:ATP-dependent protease ClpP protease subunit